jgi:hypothetical protein
MRNPALTSPMLPARRACILVARGLTRSSAGTVRTGRLGSARRRGLLNSCTIIPPVTELAEKGKTHQWTKEYQVNCLNMRNPALTSPVLIARRACILVAPIPQKWKCQVSYFNVRSPALTSPSHLARRACTLVAPSEKMEEGLKIPTTTRRTDPPREEKHAGIDISCITFGLIIDLLIASPINRNVKGTRGEARRRPRTDGNCWSSSAAALSTCK